MKITPPDAINPCCNPERCKIAAPAQNFANGVAAMAAARGVGLAVGAAAIANPSINDPRDDGAGDETDCREVRALRRARVWPPGSTRPSLNPRLADWKRRMAPMVSGPTIPSTLSGFVGPPLAEGTRLSKD